MVALSRVWQSLSSQGVKGTTKDMSRSKINKWTFIIHDQCMGSGCDGEQNSGHMMQTNKTKEAVKPVFPGMGVTVLTRV